MAVNTELRVDSTDAIVSTHDPQTASYADRVIEISDGRLEG